MSNYTDFFPAGGGGGGVPINGVAAIYSSQTIFTDPDGKQYLKGGNIITTGLGTYPDAELQGFNIPLSTYSGNSFDVTRPDHNAYGAWCMSFDGTYMYTNDNDSYYSHQFQLSTPWDLSTASFLERTSFGNGLYTSFHVAPNGGSIVGTAGSQIQLKILTTPFILSSATATGQQNLNVAGVTGFTWIEDGWFFLLTIGSSLRKYAAQSQYSITNGILLDTVSLSGTVRNMTVSPDGSNLIYSTDGSIRRYDFGAPFDITTLEISSSFSVSGTSASPFGCAVSQDGTKFIYADTNQITYEYDMPQYIGIDTPLTKYDYLRIL